MVKHIIKILNGVVPIIYAYITPDYTPHDSWTKIGYMVYCADCRIEKRYG